MPAYRRLSGPAYKGAFIGRYDALRPRPPASLIDLLVSLAPAHPPALVVDLGSGTGISTTPWVSRARRVVGIEVNPEMSRIAPAAPNVEYRCASADQTGLPDACADVITCGQSFHWMAPEPTIAEISRLLRPEGIFAAYDYDWPPIVDQEVDAAFLRVIEASGIDPSRPEKSAHLHHLRGSGFFSEVREIQLRARETATAEHVALLPLAFGPLARKLEMCSAGTTAFGSLVSSAVMCRPIPMHTTALATVLTMPSARTTPPSSLLGTNRPMAAPAASVMPG